MVSIFCEGILDEAILRRIIVAKTSLEVGVAVSQKGKSYIEQRARSLNKSARGSPIIALADLDTPETCPSTFVTQWLGGDRRENKFLLRFAILEAEAWIIADKRNLAQFLSISDTNVPDDVEAIRDPKETVVSLARMSRNRHVRDSLVPDRRSGALVGPNYNSEMSKFVRTHWDIDAAASRSRSLARAITRIEELAAQHQG